MATIWIVWGEGFKEVDARFVPGTAGLFAVREVEHAEQVNREDLFWRPWVLTHTPTGYAAFRGVTDVKAEDLARQLYAAAPDAWAQKDADAVKEALPPPVREYVRRLTNPCFSFRRLKSLAAFIRDYDVGEAD